MLLTSWVSTGGVLMARISLWAPRQALAGATALVWQVAVSGAQRRR